jgi:hypothetical protein
LRNSKKIKELESRIEEISAITDILILLVNDMFDDKTRTDLDSGKWYKQKP